MRKAHGNAGQGTVSVTGPLAALASLQALAAPPWLTDSYLFDAVPADLHRRAGDGERARQHAAVALDAAPTDAVRRLLRRRLQAPA